MHVIKQSVNGNVTDLVKQALKILIPVCRANELNAFISIH